MRFQGAGVLLDIEGTTSSVRFVHEVMFPYVREHLEAFLTTRFDDPEVLAALDRMAVDAGHVDWRSWRASRRETSSAEVVRDEVHRLMDIDAKATGLKQLQGLIWRDGFQGGRLTAHVYEDAVACLKAWRADGWDLRIYSSGSVQAQKLFFGYSQAGNLLDLFRGHYDTTIGGKKEPESYRRIALEFGQPAERLLFLSDIVAELDAAAAAGWQTALSVRPENPAAGPHTHPVIRSFHEVRLEKDAAT